MRKLAVVVLAAVVAGLCANVAKAKLTPTESKWAAPLINSWNLQNAALENFIKAATAKYALIPGTPDNAKLNRILEILVGCADTIKKAGAPPSPRLNSFLTPMKAGCAYDVAGSLAMGKAIGAVKMNESKLAGQYETVAVTDFKHGTAELAAARKAIIAIGGANLFTA